MVRGTEVGTDRATARPGATAVTAPTTGMDTVTAPTTRMSPAVVKVTVRAAGTDRETGTDREAGTDRDTPTATAPPPPFPGICAR